MLALAAVLGACTGPEDTVRDALWIGRLGVDTVVVEASRREGSRITGTIVNVAAGMLVQRYEVDLDADHQVGALRSWTVDDLSDPRPTDGDPQLSVVVTDDSIRVTRAGSDGPVRSAIPALPGAVPLLDAFFNSPIALLDMALQIARVADADKLHIYYVGGSEVDEPDLERVDVGHVAFAYPLAERYPMLAGARVHARLDAAGLVELDARETTFKIVTERRPWADALALAKEFRERGLGTGGFSTMSPPGRVSGRIGSVDVEVTYGQPSRRGRRIFPDVVPFGKVWRAGANAATRVTFSGNVLVGRRPVPAGSYSVWVLPGGRADTLILNKADRVWGVGYDAVQDLVRVPMRRERLRDPVETLEYGITGEGTAGRLELAWDDRRLSVTVEPMPM